MLHTHSRPSGAAAGLYWAPRAATSAPRAAAACGTRGSGSSRGAAFRAGAHDPFPLPGVGSAAAPGTAGGTGLGRVALADQSRISVFPPARVAGEIAGGQLLSPVRKDLWQPFLSSPPTPQCPGYAAGHAEHKPR